MHPDEQAATSQHQDQENSDPVRDGLDHLQAAGRELVAAARAAIEACEGIVDDPEMLRTAAASVSDFCRSVARSTGLASEHGNETDDPEAGTAPHGGRTSSVEHIPLDPG